MEGHELYDSVDALDDVGDSQVLHSADTESEIAAAAAHAATVHCQTKIVSLLNCVLM